MKKALLVLALGAALVGVAQADTLKKIKDTGSVTMGVRESSGALSYTLGDGKYVGYHVEICQRVLADGIPDVHVLTVAGDHDSCFARVGEFGPALLDALESVRARAGDRGPRRAPSPSV